MRGLVGDENVLESTEAEVTAHFGERGELAALLNLDLGGDGERVGAQVLPRESAAEKADFVRGISSAQRAPLIAGTPEEIKLKGGCGIERNG